MGAAETQNNTSEPNGPGHGLGPAPQNTCQSQSSVVRHHRSSEVLPAADVPVASMEGGLCSKGLQDKLLRTIAAISSSTSTSFGLRLWLQDRDRQTLVTGTRLGNYSTQMEAASDLRGTSMQEETGLLLPDTERDVGQTEPSTEGSAAPQWKYT